MLRPFGQSEKSGCLKIARRTALEPVEAGDALDITSKQPVAKSVAHQPTTTTELRSAGTARKWPTTLETVHSVITRRIGRIRSIKKTERFVLPDRQLEPVIVQAAYATRMPHSDEEIVPWPGSNVQSIIAPLTHEASLARQDLLLYQLKNSINRLAALHGPYSDAVSTELQLATSLRAFLQAVNSLRDLDNCDKRFKAQLEKRAARHVVCREMRSNSKQIHPVKRIWARRTWEHSKRRNRCEIYRAMLQEFHSWCWSSHLEAVAVAQQAASASNLEALARATMVDATATRWNTSAEQALHQHIRTYTLPIKIATGDKAALDL